jgi:hypothetical protein
MNASVAAWQNLNLANVGTAAAVDRFDRVNRS